MSRDDLVGHVNFVHECFRFQCDVCGEGFLSEGGMVGHVNSVHGCWRFLCDVCGEGFLSRDDMIVLVNSVHDWYLKSSFNSVHVI